eukprot:3219797-Rhodomonas_salina.2
MHEPFSAPLSSCIDARQATEASDTRNTVERSGGGSCEALHVLLQRRLRVSCSCRDDAADLLTVERGAAQKKASSAIAEGIGNSLAGFSKVKQPLAPFPPQQRQQSSTLQCHLTRARPEQQGAPCAALQPAKTAVRLSFTVLRSSDAKQRTRRRSGEGGGAGD